MSVFLQIDGIKGDATHAEHVDWVLVHDVRFGTWRRMATAPGVAGNRRPGVAGIAPVRIWKRHDPASVNLFAAVTGMGAGRAAALHFLRSGSPGGTYLEVTLRDVLVATFKIGPSSAGSLLEYLVLDCTRIDMRHTPVRSDNAALPPVAAAYDLTAAIQC